MGKEDAGDNASSNPREADDSNVQRDQKDLLGEALGSSDAQSLAREEIAMRAREQRRQEREAILRLRLEAERDMMRGLSADAVQREAADRLRRELSMIEEHEAHSRKRSEAERDMKRYFRAEAEQREAFDRLRREQSGTAWQEAMARHRREVEAIGQVRPPGLIRTSPELMRAIEAGDVLSGVPPTIFKEWEAKLRDRDLQLDQTKAAVLEAQKLAGQNAAKASEAEGLRKKLEAELDEKKKHIELSHLLTRVSPKAAELLLHNEAFRGEFLQSPCPAFVMAIDVRRSTELMLKARDPAGFAQFLITLASALKNSILLNNGVFEKFTGDGVLAYFPTHFTGTDAAFFALKAAEQCHAVFEKLYKDNRHRFNSVIKNTGLGIGIDFGLVHTMVVSGEFAVVGTPVVYACRMAGAQAGQTLLNQGAFEEIVTRYEAYCELEETEIDIKHEGPTVAYKVELNAKPFELEEPSWKRAPAEDARAVPEPVQEPEHKEGENTEKGKTGGMKPGHD
jgi:class 3 adenylate cyclase